MEGHIAALRANINLVFDNSVVLGDSVAALHVKYNNVLAIYQANTVVKQNIDALKPVIENIP